MQSFKLKFKEILLISALIFAFSSCKKSDDNQTTDTSNKTAPYESGVFIANQGGYGKGNGSISYYDRSGKVVSDVFQLVNNRPLGDIVQSMSIYNGKAYIVVNNSGKVEVADAGTFSSTGVIKNLTSPRYFVGISSSKGYISDWGSGTTGGNIKVVDLTSNTITKTIAAGKYPDKMILSGTKLFVINSAGLDKDSTITIIDTQTDTPMKTLVIGGDPTGIVTDANGKIWVLCSGIEDYATESNSTPGKIVRINPNDYSIEYTYTFPDNTKHPNELCANSAKKRLFY
ncbi:MAG: hypothetical protein Q8880_10165, partial [Bacteroidota bacterium]|nr:hypothetical protein [Bacteroidota bacterium]